MKQKFLKPSNNPLDDINRMAYEGQPIKMRMYKEGFEQYLEAMPILEDDDEMLLQKTHQTTSVMNLLAADLSNSKWAKSMRPIPGDFNRTILALEAPMVKADGTLKEGTEIVLARWGDGHTSPVHGHASGYLHEELLFGKMRVNTYRIVDRQKRIVRPLRTVIYDKPSTIAAVYSNHSDAERDALVHNFTSIGYSGSLHYLPEHTRDGRDNRFAVEHFTGLASEHLIQLNAQQGLEQLRIGDVALVRSQNVPEYGDHFIVITGRPILKPNGLRPMDDAIYAPHYKGLLDAYDPIMGLTLLKLNDTAKKAFHIFHSISVVGNNVIFPQ